MTNAKTGMRITLSNILYLTDFSEPSEQALLFVAAIAREYRANVCALHVVLPDPYTSVTPELAAEVAETQEQNAHSEMQRIAERLKGCSHEVHIEKGLGVWSTLEPTIRYRDIDLIVLGTHGRTGVERFLLGSVAEEVFRKSRVPVLTIGPSVKYRANDKTPFRCVLFATDFTTTSRTAAPCAFSLAEENQARLVLLHVIPHLRKEEMLGQLSVADAMHQLYESIPADAELWCRPEPIVEYGPPADRILAIAEQREADLIVLGIRHTEHVGFETHIGRTTAHEVVAHANCAVLTVRG